MVRALAFVALLASAFAVQHCSLKFKSFDKGKLCPKTKNLSKCAKACMDASQTLRIYDGDKARLYETDLGKVGGEKCKCGGTSGKFVKDKNEVNWLGEDDDDAVHAVSITKKSGATQVETYISIGTGKDKEDCTETLDVVGGACLGAFSPGVLAGIVIGSVVVAVGLLSGIYFAMRKPGDQPLLDDYGQME